MLLALVLSVVAPAVVAVVLLAVGHRPWGEMKDGRWSLALAIPACAFAAYFAVRGAPAFPPADASVWPLWIGVVAAALAVLEAKVELPRVARGAAWLGLALVTAYLVSRPRIEFAWDTGDTVAWIAGSTLAIAVVWVALEVRAERVTGSAVPLAMTIWGAGVATVLGLSGTALLAQTAGGVAAALGVATARGVWRQSLPVARAVVGPSVIVLGGLLLGGVHYADVGFTSVGLVVVGAVLVGLLSLPALSTAGLRTTATLGIVVLIASGAAVMTTVWPADDAPADSASTEANDDSDYGYGYD
ncbi:MAG: hypothetical protein RIT81_03080 [Deltaproteobacteria bacterium]